MTKLNLKNVTLFSLSSRDDIDRTSIAIKHCLNQVEFGEVIHVAPFDNHEIKHETEKRLATEPLNEIEYSKFMINNLHDNIDTDFVLTVQWDGFIINASRWTDKFFDYDYIGAPWEFLGSKNNVGNGGFSLRSKKFLEVCQGLEYSVDKCDWFIPLQGKHRPIPPEDWYLCYNKYETLIARGIKFPSVGIARSFSVENSHFNTNFYNPSSLKTYRSFGFHGVNNSAAMDLLNAK